MILLFLNYFGTAVFAITGAYAAARKKMDITGVLLLAFVVGNGGGTLRDLFLGFSPVFWVNQHEYIWLTMGTGIIALVFARFFTTPDRIILLADALGLGVFVVTGAEKTLHAGFSPIIAVMMGILTGAGGGILRDLICNEIPLFLHREIYITAALIGGIIFIIAMHFAPTETAAFISIAFTVLIRIAAIYLDWQLPVFKPDWFYKTQEPEEKN